MKYILILIVFLSGVSFGYSQQIQGRVTDTENQPIEFANVALYSLPDSALVTGTVTNPKGEFSLTPNGAKESILIISFIGYETQIVSATTGQTIILKDDSNFLQEVVVKGTRKAFQMQNGNIVANVSGTVLGKEVNALEVLRKIPGMTLKEGQLSSFIGGTPIVYINGKKAQSMTEVQQLEVKNINTVELNTNPGAEYDASTGAVLLITTHNRLEGLAVQVENYTRKNSSFSHDNAMKINYKKNKINIFGQIEYSDFRKKNGQDLTTIVYAPDTVWRSDMPMRELTRSSKTLEYTIGADYEISKNHSIGIKYDGNFNNTYSHTLQPLTLWAGEKIFTKIDGNSDKNEEEDRHYVNGYYRGKLTDKLQIDVYMDWLNRKTNETQTVVEKSVETGNTTTKIITNSINNLFGITPKFQYKITDRHKLSTGTDFNSVGVETVLNYDPEIFTNTNSKTSETKIAGFLDYSYNNENGFSFGIGLRYEWVNSQFNDLNNAKKDLHRVYSNLFPSVQVNYRKGLATQGLSYRNGITRPSFSTLNGRNYYVNRFVYQEGNPKLEPEILHNVQYNFMYRFIYFSLKYSYIKNTIQMEYQSPTLTSNIIKGTWTNYDNQQRLQAILNLRHTFGFYTPSLTLAYTQNFLDVPVNNTIKRINKPFGYINFNNDFDFSNGFLFNAEYTFNGGGTFGALYIGQTHVFNARIQKTFFNNKLQASLNVNDIFGKDIIRLNGQIHHIHMNNVDYQDRRSVSLNLIWRFNNYKKTYKGQSASQNEINRL